MTKLVNQMGIKDKLQIFKLIVLIINGRQHISKMGKHYYEMSSLISTRSRSAKNIIKITILSLKEDRRSYNTRQ